MRFDGFPKLNFSFWVACIFGKKPLCFMGNTLKRWRLIVILMYKRPHRLKAEWIKRWSDWSGFFGFKWKVNGTQTLKWESVLYGWILFTTSRSLYCFTKPSVTSIKWMTQNFIYSVFTFKLIHVFCVSLLHGGCTSFWLVGSPKWQSVIYWKQSISMKTTIITSSCRLTVIVFV